MPPNDADAPLLSDAAQAALQRYDIVFQQLNVHQHTKTQIRRDYGHDPIKSAAARK